jgi:hypothetical protein
MASKMNLVKDPLAASWPVHIELRQRGGFVHFRALTGPRTPDPPRGIPALGERHSVAEPGRRRVGEIPFSITRCTRPICCKDLVGVTGFEPATSCSQSKRATGLRYTPTEGELCHFGGKPP